MQLYKSALQQNDFSLKKEMFQICFPEKNDVRVLYCGLNLNMCNTVMEKKLNLWKITDL